MKVRLPFCSLRNFIMPTSCFLLLVSLAACSEQKKERQSRQSMENELQDLKSKSSDEAIRIRELELALQEEKNSQAVKDVLEQDQEKSAAEFEAYRQQHLQESNAGSPSREQDSQPLADNTAAAGNRGSDGFSFVAVRNAPPSPPTQTQPAAATPTPSLSPSERKLADLRSQLREELNDIIDKIRERRRIRYGDVDSSGNRTYIPLSSYDPKTGQNKKGGGKAPKLDVDLENGVNQEYPEKSSCFSAQSLSATLSHARLLRDEINDLKGEMTR